MATEEATSVTIHSDHYNTSGASIHLAEQQPKQEDGSSGPDSSLFLQPSHQAAEKQSLAAPQDATAAQPKSHANPPLAATSLHATSSTQDHKPARPSPLATSLATPHHNEPTASTDSSPPISSSAEQSQITEKNRHSSRPRKMRYEHLDDASDSEQDDLDSSKRAAVYDSDADSNDSSFSSLSSSVSSVKEVPIVSGSTRRRAGGARTAASTLQASSGRPSGASGGVNNPSPLKHVTNVADLVQSGRSTSRSSSITSYEDGFRLDEGFGFPSAVKAARAKRKVEPTFTSSLDFGEPVERDGDPNDESKVSGMKKVDRKSGVSTESRSSNCYKHARSSHQAALSH